jgi:signal transduction histidine kinase
MSYIFPLTPGLNFGCDVKKACFHAFARAFRISFTRPGADMTTTLLMRTRNSPGCEAARKALRDAGVGIVEVDDWEDAAAELRKCDAAWVVCDHDSIDATWLRKAIAKLTDSGESGGAAIAPEAARALSHELRTPLSAMAGWVHLMETGKLDEAGLKRVITKLRGNIEDQVRTIERYLGATNQEGRQ